VLPAPGADRNRVIVDRKVKGKKGGKKQPSGAHRLPTRSMIALLNNWDA
jgi:hypothetical protein